MKKSYVHKTSTGKEFLLTNLDGDPLDYKEGKGVFTKSYVAGLEVNQILRSSRNGMELKRLK